MTATPATSTVLPTSPGVPRLAAWLNRRSAGRSAPAPVVRFHRWAYARTGGRIGHGLIGAPSLVLTTTGRCSGQLRSTVLVYLRDGDDYLVAASNEGADRPPAWLRNLQANPAVELRVKRQRVTGTASTVWPGDPGYDRMWAGFDHSSGGRYGRYQAKTARPIPVVVITPSRPA